MSGALVSLQDCPPGLFRFQGMLGFKTEYGASVGKDMGCGKVEWTVTQWPDAYCVDSGETFWGGTSKQEDRAALMVEPISIEGMSLVWIGFDPASSDDQTYCETKIETVAESDGVCGESVAVYLDPERLRLGIEGRDAADGALQHISFPLDKTRDIAAVIVAIADAVGAPE